MAGHPEHQTVFAYLSVDGVPQAMAFYEAVFGARDRGVTLHAPDGMIVHAEMAVGETAFFLAEAAADPGGAAVNLDGPVSMRLAIDVVDVDAAVARAVERGSTVLIEPADQFYGHRAGRIRDPFGHVWIVSQKLEDVSTAEMQSRLDAMMAKGSG